MSYPIPSWLFREMITEPARPDTAELGASAAATIGRLDAWLATSTPRVARATVSRCGRCRAPITTTALGCDACGFDFLAGERRSTDAEKLAAVQRALRERQRARVIADGELVEIEYRAATTTSVR